MQPSACVVLVLFTQLACEPERLQRAPLPPEAGPKRCAKDADCVDGFICVLEECVDVATFDCQGDDSGITELAPTEVIFAPVALGANGAQEVLVTNVGACNLTVEGVALGNGSHRDFSCSPCDLASFPKLIAPRRSLAITVGYAPSEPAQVSGTLQVRSDDPTEVDSTIRQVPLQAEYAGTPALVLDPPELNFGFVAYAPQAAETRTETLKIMNMGDGNAVLSVEFVYVAPPGTYFEIPSELADIGPGNTVLIPPYDEANPQSFLEVPITFTPRGNASQEAQLMVQARAGTSAETESVRVGARLVASSLGPPQIAVAPSEIEFTDAEGDPIRLGRTEYRALTIQNLGQSELAINLSLNDASGDFTFSPSFVAPILPGGAVALGLFYNASQPSDPNHPSQPESALQAFLQVVSNDAARPLTTVRLLGWSKSTLHDDVLRVEMTFVNNDSSWAQNDFRNVDLELVSPFGYSCKKPLLAYAAAGNDTYVVSGQTDYCQQWTDTGLEGTTDWISGGTFEEPERVLLYGLGTDLADGQDFIAYAHYVEDCANVPTGLVANLAGIGVSALLGILGGQVGVPITIPPDQISDLIEENCWDHEPTVASLVVFVNGQEVASVQKNLGSKGQSAELWRLRREDGTFSIAP